VPFSENQITGNKDGLWQKNLA